MIQARQMHPSEMRSLLPEISRATGKHPGHLAARLSLTHRHGCILLEQRPAKEPGAPKGDDLDLEDDGPQPSIFGFLLYRLDHKGATAWLLESAVYPQARPEGGGLMIRRLTEDLEAMGLSFRTATMVPEDDPAAMEALRGLGFKARGVRRDHHEDGRDAFEMVLPAPGVRAHPQAGDDGGKTAGPGRIDSATL